MPAEAGGETARRLENLEPGKAHLRWPRLATETSRSLSLELPHERIMEILLVVTRRCVNKTLSSVATIEQERALN